MYILGNIVKNVRDSIFYIMIHCIIVHKTKKKKNNKKQNKK